MSSYRPRTPPRSSYDSSVATPAAGKTTTGYVPHIFDLVSPGTDASRLTKQHIPAIFLEAEAVDSSTLLGNGASFSASLQRIPDGPERVEVTAVMSTFTVRATQPSPPRAKYIVYKVARVAFQENGEPDPQSRMALQSVLTEYHALIYPSLFDHANIINFLGIAWSSNPFSPSHKLPALILEYAQYGTLADLLHKTLDLDFVTKHSLCLDTARGLAALHAVGLVHGDVKAQNVLICSGDDRKYVGKIADFGFSIVEATESAEVWVGGTNPWKAPETKGPIPVNALSRTDVFSLGLLIWLVCIDGRIPFDLVIPQDIHGVARTSKVEELKQNNGLLDQAKTENWLLKWLHEKYEAGLDKNFEEAIDIVSTMTNITEDDLIRRYEIISENIYDKFYQGICAGRLVCKLDAIFEHALQTEPNLRDLATIIKLLESDLEPLKGATYRANVATLPSWKMRGFKSRRLSWQEMRDLDPAVQNLIFDSFPGSDGPELFVLCAFFMNGYGTERNLLKALQKMKQAADMNFPLAQAYLYRISSACKSDLPGSALGVEYLYNYALIGSRAALEDLQIEGPAEKAQHARRFLDDACAGTGAPWFSGSEMLHGYIQGQWLQDDFFMDQVDKIENLSQFQVNKRGDSMLHFAASCGRHRPFKALIVDRHMNINQRNPVGETPLLCACRSGQGGIAILCLKNYRADASISATNGETPLHWLISFDDQYIEPIVADLLANGANIKAWNVESVSHSEFSSSIDVDFQIQGTALSWAVHQNRPHIVRVLLKNGANPHWSHQSTWMSPLEWAAHYHHTECLKVFVEHLEGVHAASNSDNKGDTRFALMYGPLIKWAVHAADQFSMILRHGADYLKNLHSTLDFLCEKTRLMNFESSFGGSVLYYAVSEAHDQVVDYMFQNDWCIKTLNQPCRDARRTPVLEAIRWNRRPLFQTLVDHGADIHALAANPFRPSLLNWSALHIFAHEGQTKDVSIVQTLVESGVPVDGLAASATDDKETKIPNISSLSLNGNSPVLLQCETPFAIALRHNAFHLASTLLSLHANPNALTLSSGLFTSSRPLTILGHVIISNARYSSARLKFLLNLTDPPVEFIVNPTRHLSALHRAAMAFRDVGKVNGGSVEEEEFDMGTNGDLMYELLLKWKRSEQLDMKCDIRDRTALHLAVEVGNLGAVEALVGSGANMVIEDEDGETALEMAERLAGKSERWQSILKRMREGMSSQGGRIP